MKTILCFIAALILAASSFSSANAAVEADTQIKYVLMEARTRTVLQQQRPGDKTNAGYLTKLMTLLLIAQDMEEGRYSADTVVTASSSVEGTKGSVIWLRPGDKITVGELIEAAAVGNANDAVTVLAENSEETVGEFTKRMNAQAFTLGLRDTSFYSPYGYEEDGNVTTAYDTAVICAELSGHEIILPYFGIWHDHIREGTVELVNENTLARTFDQHIGFKAAHSEQSGYCAAEAGRSESGDVFIAVVSGCKDSESSLRMAKDLVTEGFRGYRITSSLFPDEMLRPVSVRGGTEQSVMITLASQNDIAVPKGMKKLTTVTVLPEYLDAPLEKGQKIGTAAFYNGDTLLYESSIIVKNDVDKLSFRYVFKEMMLNILN